MIGMECWGYVPGQGQSQGKGWVILINRADSNECGVTCFKYTGQYEIMNRKLQLAGTLEGRVIESMHPYLLSILLKFLVVMDWGRGHTAWPKQFPPDYAPSCVAMAETNPITLRANASGEIFITKCRPIAAG